jgi:hypothetical protein
MFLFFPSYRMSLSILARSLCISVFTQSMCLFNDIYLWIHFNVTICSVWRCFLRCPSKSCPRFASRAANCRCTLTFAATTDSRYGIGSQNEQILDSAILCSGIWNVYISSEFYLFVVLVVISLCLPKIPCLYHHFSCYIHRNNLCSCRPRPFVFLSRSQLKIAPTSAIVVESGNKDDPTAVCKENTLKVIRTDARKFYTAPEIRFALTRTGIKVRAIPLSISIFEKFVNERPGPFVEFAKLFVSAFSVIFFVPPPLWSLLLSNCCLS